MGMLNLYSITSDGELSGSSFFAKQVVWMLIGLAIMMTVAFVEYRFYSDFAYMTYLVTLFLLLAVMGYGYITSGAQRWIKIGSISFQPSEFVKISLILALARFFQQPTDREGYRLKDLSRPFLFVLFPLCLILRQPDLGTAILLVLIFVSVLLFVKVRWTS